MPVARPVSSVQSVITRNFFVSVPTNVSYHVVCRVPTVTRWQSQKKDVRPKLKIKSQIKCVKSASFVGHFVSAPNVPNVPNVASVQPVGGRLQSFWEIWAHKGANPKVVSILKEGYVLPFKVRPPLVRDPLIVSGYANPIRDSHLQAAVQALIEKKAVERVRVQTSLAFFNRLFIVPKPNHKWRPILDLSTLNQFLCVKTFKMETPETIRTSLQQEEWVTSLDFSDAYFHIPIHYTSRKFLRFHFQNQSYQFRALPFGLSTAPMEFTGVVKEVKLMAQSQGIRIHKYLDDWLIRAPTKESCHQGTQSLLALCQELGWMVNMQKSELEPQQVFDFVGYQHDLLNGVVRPTQNRWETLQQKITVLLQNRSCPVRTFMSLIGLLTATEKQVTLGRLHMRPIQWHLKKHWRVPESLEKEIPIPRSLHQYLQWWTQEENVLKGQPLHPLRHAVQIFTDASKEGWGAHLGDFTASGTWSVPESKLHINFLELKAVLLALKRFQHLVQGKVVLIATDNTTVVAYINKEGGMRSGSLCALLWRLLCWCSLNQIVLKARHIPGRLNVIADKLSRQRQVIQTEWSLHQETFDLLCQTWHYPRVDMFATRYNCKLVQFLSPIPDPKAWSVDALTLSWEDLDMYLFPPVSLMGKVVSKLSDHWYRRAILIAPGWPNMPWFWDLVELSARVPLCLPHHPDLVTQPFNKARHRDLTNLNLHAWLLEPRQSRSRGSLAQWRQELRRLKDVQPEQSTKRSGPFLSDGVKQVRWTSGTHLYKEIADFLLHLFQEKNLQPSTIDGYRSAIADKLGNTSVNVGKDENLTRLLDSFHRDRPKGRRGVPAWNLSLVLHQLTKAPFEPLRKASLKHLTFKTVFLLALASGKRRSEIHAWLNKNIRHQADWSKVSLYPSPSFLAKNHFAKEGPECVAPVVIPALAPTLDKSLKEDRSLCPVRALRYYLDKTQDLRTGKELVFVSFKQGFNKDISPATISSWIKQTVVLCYDLSDQDSLTGRGGSTIGAPKALKRDYQLVSPTTPEGQVTLCNIRALLKEAIEPLADDLEQVKQKLDAITVVNARVDTLELKVDNLETRLLQSETKCSELQKEVVKLEMYSRKNNLKFLNIKDPHSASNENCEEKILDLCAYHNVELDARNIETAHRLGRSTKIDRPIMVKFSNFKSKQKILRARKTFQTQNIKVAEDFPTAIQQRRRIFSPILQEIFRSGGKYRGKLVQDKLLLNDRFYCVNTSYPMDNCFTGRRDRSRQTPEKDVLYMLPAGPVTECAFARWRIVLHFLFTS